MSTPYTPDAAGPIPATFTDLTDDDLQRATSYNAPFQELQDAVAFLGRSGSTAAMKAVTGAVLGNKYFSTSIGAWYYYDSSTSIGSASSPWLEAATGMGAGCWVHEAFLTILNGAVPTKINPALLGPQIVKTGNSVLTGDYIGRSVTGFTSFTALQSSGGAFLDTTITPVIASDRVRVKYGPFEVVVGPGDLVTLQVAITQTGGGALFEKIVKGGTSEAFFENIDFDIEYISQGAGDITIGVNVKQTTGSASAVSMGHVGVPNWGPGGVLQYAYWSVIRG